MNSPIRNLIYQELSNNEIVKLQELYEIVDTLDDPSRNKTQKHHLVRSLLDSYRRSGKILRIADQTYSKVDEKF